MSVTHRSVLTAVDEGRFQQLDGRGVNISLLVHDDGRPLSVKVHCPSRSSQVDLHRIRHLDEVLDGFSWYPSLVDAGIVDSRLVVVRPFVPGTPIEDAKLHIGDVVEVLGALAGRGGVPASAETVGDYATAWLLGRQTLPPFSAGHRDLARAAGEHLPELMAAARSLTGDTAMAYHGDLHGRNLVAGAAGRFTVIDWDEAGFSSRPADAGKALWLSCRRERGDFRLDPEAVRNFLVAIRTRLPRTMTGAVEVARLGALWFVPTAAHVTLLARRDASMVPWYLGWVSRFWARYRENSDIVRAADPDRAGG